MYYCTHHCLLNNHSYESREEPCYGREPHIVEQPLMHMAKVVI